jgi:hypothetical protein
MSEDIGTDIDYILENIVGGGGRWQWAIVGLLYPIGVASGFPLLIHMFAAFAPRHRCFIPGCDDNSTFNDIDTIYKKFALPTDHKATDMFIAEESFDPCNMYESTDPGSCSADSFDNSTSVPCESFVYDLSLFPETLTTKLDLVSFTIHFYCHAGKKSACNLSITYRFVVGVNQREDCLAQS